jgi:hypothetical protein
MTHLFFKHVTIKIWFGVVGFLFWLSCCVSCANRIPEDDDDELQRLLGKQGNIEAIYQTKESNILFNHSQFKSNSNVKVMAEN